MELPERKTLEDKEMFDDIVQAILSVMGDDAVKIILYGSVARGDNTWESDVDIAVLTTREYNYQDKKPLYEVTSKLGLQYYTLFSVIAIEEKHFYDWLDDLPFYHNIDIEGLTLWTNETGRICLDTALNERQKNLIPQNSY